VDYLPICVDVRGRRCLVVGGGAVASRKASMLVRAGAAVVVVAPELGDAVRQLGQQGDAEVAERVFDEGDLDGVRLVVAATDEASANRSIAAAAQLRGLWVNVVDDPAHCNFVMPAIVDRDPVLIAVSSSGRSPVLARTTRARIEAMLPPRLGELAVLLGSYRDRVKAQLSTTGARRRFWEGVVEGPVAELVQAGRSADAVTALEESLAAAGQGEAAGAIFVVHPAGEDPDLLTLRMLRLMQRAEVVAHPAGFPEALLELCRRDAGRVQVPSDDADATAQRLVELSADGQRVCYVCLSSPAAVVERLAGGPVPTVEA